MLIMLQNILLYHLIYLHMDFILPVLLQNIRATFKGSTNAKKSV